MSAGNKIVKFFKDHRKGLKDAKFSELKITNGRNKDGNSLLYVKVSILEKENGINYSNICYYYAFDMNGNYVGQVKLMISDRFEPTEIEMEYYACSQYQNKGNITMLAREVIRDIFEEKAFNGLMVRKDRPTSNIESIMVAINPDNSASLAVAKKLGFNDKGYLHINEYYSQIKDVKANKNKQKNN